MSAMTCRNCGAMGMPDWDGRLDWVISFDHPEQYDCNHQPKETS